jgi:hypothetical protein
MAENKEWDRDESLAKINKPSNHHNSNSMSHSKSASAISNSYQDGSSYQEMSYQNKEFRDNRDSFFNSLQSQNSQRPENLRPSEGTLKFLLKFYSLIIFLRR